jgi:hypothetical protein
MNNVWMVCALVQTSKSMEEIPYQTTWHLIRDTVIEKHTIPHFLYCMLVTGLYYS